MKNDISFLKRAGVLALYVGLIFSVLILISWGNRKMAAQTPKPAANAVVVLELFTSQGCSSCPPADALLGEYASSHNMRIIPLSFHVDYWDRLGWKDPFSDHAFTERQQQYSHTLPGHEVYTPQLVVNGRSETVGNNRNSVKNLIQKELSAGALSVVSIERADVEKNMVGFHYTVAGNKSDDQLAIALVQKHATTPIRAGENEGVTLTNHNVVGSVATQPLTAAGNGTVAIPANFKAADYSLVVFLQNKKTLAISSAAIKDL